MSDSPDLVLHAFVFADAVEVEEDGSYRVSGIRIGYPVDPPAVIAQTCFIQFSASPVMAEDSFVLFVDVLSPDGNVVGGSKPRTLQFQRRPYDAWGYFSIAIRFRVEIASAGVYLARLWFNGHLLQEYRQSNKGAGDKGHSL